MGPRIQWVHSYVTDDKFYCVYVAPDEKTVLDHARRGGFPANRVSRVTGIIDPTSAEGSGAVRQMRHPVRDGRCGGHLLNLSASDPSN